MIKVRGRTYVVVPALKRKLGISAAECPKPEAA